MNIVLEALAEAVSFIAFVSIPAIPFIAYQFIDSRRNEHEN